LEKGISRLMRDDDVPNKKGVYAYVLDGKEKHLNIRAFNDNMKREAYERQKGIRPCVTNILKFKIRQRLKIAKCHVKNATGENPGDNFITK
jgi:hypothetical protein